MMFDFETLVSFKENNNSRWTWTEDKLFETGLVQFPDGFPNRWERIAAVITTKSAAAVERHYAVLMNDVAMIEAGLIEPPEYGGKKAVQSTEPKPEKNQIASVRRKMARAWSVEEHRLFLEGLEKYGKGDWKSISRYVVLTRSPCQVASHAQKYYERKRKEEQRKKRKSIFDSTIPEGTSMTEPKLAY